MLVELELCTRRSQSWVCRVSLESPVLKPSPFSPIKPSFQFIREFVDVADHFHVHAAEPELVVQEAQIAGGIVHEEERLRDGRRQGMDSPS